MANSRNSQLINGGVFVALNAHLRPLLTHKTSLCVGIAYSGGLDSTVLLHSVVEFIARLKSTHPVTIRGIHVHHGLSLNADQWADHCSEQCHRYDVPLSIKKVFVTKHRASLEDAARQARYKVFDEFEVDYLLLAHHQDDQAETLLMNLLRGSGVLGGAAIPLLRKKILRPFLHLPKSLLKTYALENALCWIEDETNQSLAHSRNYLRHELIPELQRRFPATAQSLASAAASFSEAQSLLEELAKEDGAGQVPLPVQILKALCVEKSKARALNAFAFNLRSQGERLPSRAWLEEGLRQVISAGNDRQVILSLGDKVVRRYQGAIYVVPRQAQAVADVVSWNGKSSIEWAGQRIQVHQSAGNGIRLKSLTEPLEFRPRLGGETIKLPFRRHRPVKDLLREAGIPPWIRETIPLLFHGEVLVWVPYVGIAENYTCNAEDDGISLEFALANW